MAIKKIELENFTVFENVAIDFCEGVNVFIGENGTGKTHLLKAISEICDSELPIENGYDVRLSKTFDCFNCPIINLIRNKKRETKVTLSTDKARYEIEIRYYDKMDAGKFIGHGFGGKRIPAVFVPAKEMLTHSGLEKDYIDRNLPFDVTLIDIINKAGISTLRTLPDEMCSIMTKIEQIIGGKVLYENNRYFIVKSDDIKIDFAVEAEGYKKLGLIYRMIETGNIAKGSVLIWDEPESNINPNNIPIIVNLLLELQRNGVQIFIATHSYDVARWFELNAVEGDKLRYFNLKKTDNGVKCSATAETYKSLSDSVIEDASDKLYNAVMKKMNGEQANG